MIEKMWHGLKNLLGVGRGVVSNDSGDFQLVQVQFNSNETKDDIPRYSEYGCTSVPPDGHNALVLFFGGNKSTGVVVATHHAKSRKKDLKKGEVCYHDDQGQEIHFKRDGLVIKAKKITFVDEAGTTVTLDGVGGGSISSVETFTINGVEFKDGIVKADDVVVDEKSVAEHKHNDPISGQTSTMI
ncbi:phage baseplate assembly protein V [Acinetobacter venetianus]|uniref:phage baseplate assembly protein V n=1 Tax=Acinetobacter venetianus TaxID=52133 RepID=UPI00215060EE|nr:phage baseplate assembly protein V [Acinetobacter venetianus]MCR4530220.1 phage baseplate assembly protein V [Acinetobacter venetianus]